MKRKTFLLAASMLTALTMLLLFNSQYNDYRALALNDAWLKQFYQSDLKLEIEKAILNKKRVDISKENTLLDIDVMPTGLVIYKPRQIEQGGVLIVLYPIESGGKIQWRCFGGRNKYIPKECR